MKPTVKGVYDTESVNTPEGDLNTLRLQMCDGLASTSDAWPGACYLCLLAVLTYGDERGNCLVFCSGQVACNLGLVRRADGLSTSGLVYAYRCKNMMLRMH